MSSLDAQLNPDSPRLNIWLGKGHKRKLHDLMERLDMSAGALVKAFVDQAHRKQFPPEPENPVE